MPTGDRTTDASSNAFARVAKSARTLQRLSFVRTRKHPQNAAAWSTAMGSTTTAMG